MGLPYENTTSGKNALTGVQEMLRSFGCDNFSTGESFSTGEVFIQFEYRGKTVSINASAKGYAQAWLKEHPYNGSRHRCSRSEYEQKALTIGGTAVYSIIRDWVKSQITVIEIGVMSFEGAFLSHFMLPDGRRVIDIAAQKLLPQIAQEVEQ